MQFGHPALAQVLELLGRLPEGSTGRLLEEHPAGRIGPDLRNHAAAGSRPAGIS